MNESLGDCLNDDASTYKGVVSEDRHFVEKEKLVSKIGHDIEQCSSEKCSLDKALWILRTEMLHLMKSDIELWKKLQELDNSLTEIKEDILRQNIDNACSDTSSSVSSGTESFVSAEEYNDLIFSNADDNRVKLWIDSSDFSNVQNIPIDGNQNSEALDNIDISAETKWNVHENFHKVYIIDQLLRSFRVSNSVSNKKEINKTKHINYLQDLLNSSIVDSKQTFRMKSVKEIEIVSRKDMSYYKSSIRLLSSIRMQSRIFEPSLTKWRPFALSQNSDSFIIVPPSTFSRVRPRPKLHSQANISDRGQVYLKAFFDETLEAVEHDIKDIKDETNISKVILPTVSCKESEEQTESSSCESNDVNEDNELKSETKGELEVEIDVFGSDFLEIKDGFITCRILLADIDEEIRQPSLDEDDFEYLKIDNGRVTFTPHEKDNDNGDTFYLGWLFDNKEEDEESFYIHKLFEETDEDMHDINDNMSIIGYLLKDVHF